MRAVGYQTRPSPYRGGVNRAVLPIAPSTPPKPPLVIVGMFGIGDCLHQRAGLRELMKTNTVYLESPHFLMYHDLVEQGLKVVLRSTSLHAQARTIARERPLFHPQTIIPGSAPRRKIWYHKPEIDQHGSILEAMNAAMGVSTTCLDFSLPVPNEWKAKARALMHQWHQARQGRPLLIYRPLTLRREWNSAARNADPAAYAAIYAELRSRFFVVSVAHLQPGREDIVGPIQRADVMLHSGELDFPTMAALWAEADMVLSPAGFGPVLAQAVGAPCITVYGGRESYRTTERAGAHLAPTLGINPDVPCDCHAHNHACQKHITLPPALEKVRKFVDQQLAPPVNHKTLIFATTYVDSLDRVNLTKHWLKLHQHLNPDCDFLLVDSQSPFALHKMPELMGFVPYKPGARAPRMLFNFDDNIGHLSRRGVTLGRDGWGRAFTKGLEIAIELGYEYAVHIEGDSLFRLKVMPLVQRMARDNTLVASTPVNGMRVAGSGLGWVETGLMFFNTKYVKDSKFIQRYDWPNRKAAPTPEVVVRNLIGHDLRMMPWKALRADKNQINGSNIQQLNLDWVTHSHNDQLVYQRYVEMVMGAAAVEPATKDAGPVPPPTVPAAAPTPIPKPGIKLNLGCGTNKLPGWDNFDAEIDISKPLPYESGCASFIFAEHVVEHINQRQAIQFFQECHRVLRPGGVLRICVPSIEQIMRCNDPDYFRFTTKWQKLGPTVRGAMHAILFAHGHEAAWTASLLETLLYYAGFDKATACKPHSSTHPELVNVEGHHKVIGERYNTIESCIFEGEKT